MSTVNIAHNQPLTLAGNCNVNSVTAGPQQAFPLSQVLSDNATQAVITPAVLPAVGLVLAVPTGTTDGAVADSLPLGTACRIVNAWLINGTGAGSNAGDTIRLAKVAQDGTVTYLSAALTVNGTAANGFKQYAAFDPDAIDLAAGDVLRTVVAKVGTFVGGIAYAQVVPVAP